MGALEPTEYLRQVPLFSRLSPADLERVAAITREERYPPHSCLFHAGQPGDAYYHIISGEAVVRAIQPHGRLRPVAYLREGACLGVTSLLLGEPHDATVEATTDLVALVVKRADLAQLRREIPTLDDQLLLPRDVVLKMRRARLAWLRRGEALVYLGIRHWFVLVRAVLLPTIGVLLAMVLIRGLLQAVQVDGWLIALIVGLAIYVPVLVWYVVNWRNDYLAVTTERVVRRELILFIYEARIEAPVDRVQDVVIRRSMWGNLLGFGNLYVQTAARSGIERIIFDHVVNPEEARDAIFQQIYRAQAQSQMQAGESMRSELKRSLGWSTPEEIAAQAEERIRATAVGDQPPQPEEGWHPRRRRMRLLAPLREVEGSRVTWRKHWVFLLARVSKPLLAALAWFLLLVVCFSGRLQFAAVSSFGLALGLIVAGLPIAFWLWWQTVDWGNDIYVLTDDRIIDAEKKPLFFHEDRREASLDRIQNVNLIVPGPIAALLGYGNVDIETAGGEGKFTFKQVMAPHEVQREVMSRVAHYKEMRAQIERQQRRKELADWFAAYESMRGERAQSRPATPPSPAGSPQA
jgi:uncharacterized membrane protein YdbT with pleckstrin-like domain